MESSETLVFEGWPEPGVRLVQYDDETGGPLKGA